MSTRWLALSFFTVIVSVRSADALGGEELRVESDFEGASVRLIEIDSSNQRIEFMPGGDPERGWPCWWYFRLVGVTPNKPVTLHLHGSLAAIGNRKPLSAVWAMPKRATWSEDGTTWLHTEEGHQEGGTTVYTLTPTGTSVYVAWGPPYTPSTAEAFLTKLSQRSPHATVQELCKSRDGRPVPMLTVSEGSRPRNRRFGIWVQARQHAWESGSSWVAQGFAEWLVSDDPHASWLRQHAEVFVIPIMDVDNTATGNGGKNAVPHDHNRDWSDAPHWNEVAAAQRMVKQLISEGRMDIFLDLHNPAPGDPTFFYVLPADLLDEAALSRRDRFIDITFEKISRMQPRMPMSINPKGTGPSYHPLWKQISSNWVAMNGNAHTVSLCLETAWNSKNSTTAGYRAVGANLGASIHKFLIEQPTGESSNP